MAKYLITGGAGFIGSNLAEALLGAGHQVRVLDNLSTGNLFNLQHILTSLQFHAADITEPERVQLACEDMDVVIHLAALPSVSFSVKDPLKCHHNNLTGTLNVLLAARDCEVKRVVLASSSAVYGAAAQLPNREDGLLDVLSPYALTKLAGENYARVFHHLYGLETVSLRFFNVFGPRQNPDSEYAGVITRFIDKIRSGEPPLIFGDGCQTRDFVHVDNVVAAIMAASQVQECGSGESINVGTGTSLSVYNLALLLGELTGQRVRPRFAPARLGEIRHSRADIRKARKLLGYRTKISVEQGLARLVSQY